MWLDGLITHKHYNGKVYPILWRWLTEMQTKKELELAILDLQVDSLETET